LAVPIPISSSFSPPLLPQVEDPPSHAWDQLELLGTMVVGRFLHATAVTSCSYSLGEDDRDSKRGDRAVA